MSILVQAFRDKVNKEKDERVKQEKTFDVGYPTMFLTFDFVNGTKVRVKPKDGTPEYIYNSIGIVDGSMVTVTGRAGCGKTTFVLQSAGRMIKPFPNSAIFHEDLEGGSSDVRKRQLLDIESEEEFKSRYICRNTGITTENFYQRIKAIHDIKLANKKDYEYDTKLYDSDGNRIFKLQPTIVILDSLAMLMSEKYGEEDGLSGQMAAPAIARLNTQLIKRIIPMLKIANIIFFCINHILPDPSILPKKAQTAWLKPGERVPGGETAMYLANHFLRFDDSAKLKAEEEFGISGIMVDIQLVKSRTNNSGVKIPMVLNYALGFDRELSLLVFLKQHKMVNGSGTYYFGDRSDKKFTQKKFKEKLMEDQEFAQIFMDQVKIALDILINKSSLEEVSSLDISSQMMSMLA